MYKLTIIRTKIKNLKGRNNA